MKYCLVILIVCSFLASCKNSQPLSRDLSYSYYFTHKSDTVQTASLHLNKDYVSSNAIHNDVSKSEVIIKKYDKSEVEYLAFRFSTFNAIGRWDTLFTDVSKPGAISNKLIYLDRSLASLQSIIDYSRKNKVENFNVYRFFKGGSSSVNVRSLNGRKLNIAIGEIEMLVELDKSGIIEKGYLPQYDITFKRGKKLNSQQALINPYEAVPKGYTAEEINFISSNQDTLYGTLTRPLQKNEVPVVILITGSGQVNRNQGNPPNIPFFQIADALSKNGIAVLRLDDRGTGKSTGNWSNSTMYDEAQDIADAIEWIQDVEGINSNKIALLGWSEGAIIAPMLAVKDSRVKATILMGTLGSKGTEMVDYQLRYGIENNPVYKGVNTDSLVEQTLKKVSESPKKKSIIEYNDALSNAAKLDVPVLLLHGETDRNVPVRDAHSFYKAVKSGGNNDVKLITYPSINHIFLPDPVGNTPPALLPSFKVPTVVLHDLTGWVVDKLKN